MGVDSMEMHNGMVYVQSAIVKLHLNIDNKKVLFFLELSLFQIIICGKFYSVFLAKPNAASTSSTSLAQQRIGIVKTVLQGPSSSSRHQQQQQQQNHHQQSNDTLSHNKKDEKKTTSTPSKKRNLLEVFKKPNTKDIVIDKPRKQHYVLDKTELEYIEALKVH